MPPSILTQRNHYAPVTLTLGFAAACTLDVGLADTEATGSISTTEYPGTDATAMLPTTSGPITAASVPPPNKPMLQLSYSQVKRFNFTWLGASGADYYQLWERREPGASFDLLTDGLHAESLSVPMPLHRRFAASYYLNACNEGGCTASPVVDVSDAMTGAIGYFKASNARLGSEFGGEVALSNDGNTLAVSAYVENSGSPGIDGNQSDQSSPNAGAVYVFSRTTDDVWSQQAYIKASNPDIDDLFGNSLDLSSDGNTLAVGAYRESSNATGIDGDQKDNSAQDSGAAYVFARSGETWLQQAYVKASNTDADDSFGVEVALSGDGSTLAVGAWAEDSAVNVINGSQSDNSAIYAGAVYMFHRDGDEWSQQAYVKASDNGASNFFGANVDLSVDGDTLAVGAFGADAGGAIYVFGRTDGTWEEQQIIKATNVDDGDYFGRVLALSADGNTLAAGSWFEASATPLIDGNGADNSAPEAGAAYVFTRSGGAWSQQAYIKPPNTGAHDSFGYPGLALSADGNVLAAGAHYEDSAAVGVAGEQFDNTAANSGAVYVFVRESDVWTFKSYVKASNPGPNDDFGVTLALSGSGDTLAVGAWYEGSGVVGLGGDPANAISSPSAGAVYVY